MAARLVSPNYAWLNSIAVLLLGVSSASALASNSFETQCNEAADELPAVEIPTPSLTIEVVDHGLTSATADMNAPTAEPGNESVAAAAMAVVISEASTENAAEEVSAEEAANSDAEPPGTALRLPGVSDSDLLRFRRQMYRTDI